MKVFKKAATILAALSLALGMFSIKIDAQAEAKTWYIHYDTGSDAWYASNDKKSWSFADLSLMEEGDNVVIDEGGAATGRQLTLHAPKKIGELVFAGGVSGVIYAPYVQHAYAVTGATGVVNSDVYLAESYQGSTLQVNGNVDTFVGNYDPNDVEKTFFGVTGTVKKANVKWTNNLLDNSLTIYNVQAGKLKTNEWGWVSFEKDTEYSLTPSADQAAAQAATATPGKKLDAVPKTGASELSESIVFFMLAAVFAVGAVVYKKKTV